MRKQTIPSKTIQQARKIAPWAAAFLKVTGGYIAFESITDYQTAKRQR
jgi:hypothetical protein